MLKGQTFTPPDSKRGRQYTAAKGSSNKADSIRQMLRIKAPADIHAQVNAQRAWNQKLEEQKEAKNKLQSVA